MRSLLLLSASLMLICVEPVVLRAGKPQELVVTVPSRFPLGLSTYLAVDVPCGASQSAVFQLRDQRLGAKDMLAQRDRDGHLWCVVRIQDQRLLGRQIKLVAHPVESQPGVLIEPQAEGFEFRDHDRPVLFYQKTPRTMDGQVRRAGFVHPLRGLDGEVLTQVFPSDHRHHHGVFWAWHQLWIGDKRAGDPWITKDFLLLVKQAEIVAQGPLFATLEVRSHWTSPLVTDAAGEHKPIVEELTTIRLYHALGDTQYVDFTIRLKPLLPDVRIGGSENTRGYSGFTVRVGPPEEMQIVDTSGLLSEDAVGTHARWADVSGRFASGDATSGIAILSHPSLREFPPRWLLRHYGMQNVVYPGREPIELSDEELLVIRHRLVLHRGDNEQARIADHQTAYEQ
ncbi:MAG: hypothetical protein CMJ81_22600 [Planctomycetaceae bacterium]|nr:hypothetical protein [Planctomycetaceae bacterium]MBP62571.1 hypothetical protein [Planctomycetaceae bacterium]